MGYKWYDTVRIVTSILAIIALAAHLYRGRSFWGDFDSKTKDLWWSYLAVLFAVFYGNAEAVIRHIPWETRGMISLLAVIVSLKAVRTAYKDDKEESDSKLFRKNLFRKTYKKK